MPLETIEKQKVMNNLKNMLKHPELMRQQNRQSLLNKIKSSMAARYAKKPCTVDELMQEADQFAPAIWQVYAIVNISRDDVVKIAESIVKIIL